MSRQALLTRLGLPGQSASSVILLSMSLITVGPNRLAYGQENGPAKGSAGAALTATGQTVGMARGWGSYGDPPRRGLSMDGTTKCTFYLGTPYPMTFSPADSTGTPLGSTNYGGQSTDYSGPTNFYDWWLGPPIRSGSQYPFVPATHSGSNGTTPRSDGFNISDYRLDPLQGFTKPYFLEDLKTHYWQIKYDLPGPDKPVTLTTDDPKTPPAQGGTVPSLTLQDSNVPDNQIPPTLTTDDPNTPPPTGGLTTYFFKGREIKQETGTAEQGQSVALNNQPVRVKLTGSSYDLPFSTSYLNNPQNWLTQRTNFWNGGGPLQTIVNPGQTSMIRTATNDQLLGFPSAAGRLNLNFATNIQNPTIYSYIVAQQQPGVFPNFANQINGNIVGLGDINGDGKPDIVWHGMDGTKNAWSYDLGLKSWGYVHNFTVGPKAGTGDVSGDGRSDTIMNSSNGLRYLELGESLNFGDSTFHPFYGANYDPGAKLQEQFGRNVTVNTCWLTLPGPWEPANASYAPGSDLPAASISLRRLARPARANR
jgi:hypothetical protein